jgi:hypothetical protein
MRANAMAVSGGRLVAEQVRIANASLASQAVGPPQQRRDVMRGRTWPQLGRKMLAARPLAGRRSRRTTACSARTRMPKGGDCCRSTRTSPGSGGLQPEYHDWAEPANDAGHTLAEVNFSLFFGLAVQAYESTLISDQTRFDRFSEGETSALSGQEQNGMQVFRGRGECTDCHLGPEFTFASYSALAARGALQRLRTNRLTDTGFVTPASAERGPRHRRQGRVRKPLSLAARQNPGNCSASPA